MAKKSSVRSSSSARMGLTPKNSGNRGSFQKPAKLSTDKMVNDLGYDPFVKGAPKRFFGGTN